jgi:hypothetical protein
MRFSHPRFRDIPKLKPIIHDRQTEVMGRSTPTTIATLELLLDRQAE